MSAWEARQEYRSCLAFAVITERRLWGRAFNIRRVLVFAARAFRLHRSIA